MDNSEPKSPLDEKRYLQAIDDDPVFERELVKTFLEDCRDRLAALEHAIGIADARATKHQAHTIKGAALNLGALALHRHARAIEREIDPADRDALAARFQQLCDEFRVVRDYLRERIAKSMFGETPSSHLLS